MEATPTASSEQNTPSDEPPPSDGPPSPRHHRRHIHYASLNGNPSSSIPPSSNIDNDRNRSPPPSNMNAQPPQPPDPSNPSPSNPSESQSEAQPSGQNHERMETDDDSDNTRSDSGTNTPEQSEATTEPAPQPTGSSGEAMDTAPDIIPISSDATNTQPPPPVNASSPNVFTATTFRIGVTANIGLNPSGVATILDTPSLSFNLNGVDQQTGEIRVTLPNSAIQPVRNSRQPPPPQREDSVESRTRRERRGVDRERNHNDDSSDSSDDDEDNPYWANFEEDTSAPDERELKVIEESEKNLPTATDHEHWEKTAFEALDDPEYIPADVGRISWIVKGVHGTPDKPNRESIMRSPSVRIGDFYWNIKYYPRGNDGTEQVSVYVECSPTPYEDAEQKQKETGETAPKEDASMTDAAPDLGRPHAESSNSNQMNGAPPEERQNPAAETFAAEDPTSCDQPSDKPSPDLTSSSDAEAEAPWRVAAQVCCVMYNPNEPRVYASHKSCHSYYNDNPDWGWTRFHGPWDELHLRKRYQRQPMLRNDAIAFTAYIRIVRDETKALWWDPPKDKSAWDSLEMTGVRAFKAIRPDQSSAIVAAFSTWLHLRPFLDMIRDQHIPDGLYEPETAPRPIFEELQALLEERGDYEDKTKDIPLTIITTMLDANSFDGIKKLDVVGLWEHLRRLLTLELSGASDMKAACHKDGDAFRDMLLLKQPDYFGLDPHSRKYQPDTRATAALSLEHEPISVQEALDLASQYPEKAFRLWECFPNQEQEPSRNPRVLSIELRRQHFDQDERKWMKLGHRIKLDEEVKLAGNAYTLYGMVIHSGSLESQEFYSVIRPRGPGSRWLKYAGENSPRKVSILTTKQAVSAHEGTGKPILNKKNSDRQREIAAVAYIAMYVRTDSLLDTLETPFDRKLLDARKEDHKAAPATSLEEQNPPGHPVTAFFYFDKAFSCADELETFDPWSHGAREQAGGVCQVRLNDTVKVCDIKSVLEHQLAQVSPQTVDKSVKIWILDVRQPCLGARPAFFPYELHADKPLKDVPHFVGGCRFWVGGQDPNVLQRTIEKVATGHLESLLQRAKEGESKEEPVQTTEALVEVSAETQPPAEVQPQNETQPSNLAEEGASGDEPDQTPVVIAEARREGENENDDTVMNDAPDSEHRPPPPEPISSNEPQISLNSSSSPPVRQVLSFLKVFDFENQTLSGARSISSPLSSNVIRELKKALGLETEPKSGSDDEMTDAESPQGEWDFYHERFQWAKTYELVNSSFSFEHYVISTEFLPSDMSITIPSDGAVFIAQRRPSPEQTSTLEAAGKPTTAPIFISSLLAAAYNPTYAHPHRTTSYLGSPYFSGSQSYARPHGAGTLVTLPGDAYTGPFASGQKFGSNGKMIFANKDVYEGAWEYDQPHGEGKMVYEKTGNVYAGGWKKGRRHGKGNTEWQVADEEMKLCQVCYEEEIDCLFYACGHICACEGCARQLENCPVCREKVKGVVKMRWTV